MSENIVYKNTPEFVSFLKGCKTKIDTHFKLHLENLTPPTLKANNGRRYYRVERCDETQRSAHCFIDRTNGDVLKAASWKAPAKHARGNIYSKHNGLDCMNEFGAAYLKR